MLRKILIIFTILLGFGINLYAAVIPEDARSIVKEMISQDFQKKKTLKEHKQLETLLKKLGETIKTVNGLKKENAKLKSLNSALEAKQRAKSSGIPTNNLSVGRQALEKMNQQLQQDKVIMAEDMRKKEAALYEELGTAYVQAKLYDNAIDAYAKTITLDPENAEVNYNLGLLYKHSRSDDKKAAYHLKKYLQLNPKAKNKKEVEYLIKMLQFAPGREFLKYY